MAAPNSPQWFNTGLHYAYGISGAPQGHYSSTPRAASSPAAATPTSIRSRTPASSFRSRTTSSTRAASSTCWTREARIFKYGSGVGTNFCKIRGENERLSGGGKSSGLMSFLQVGDRNAGAIKSGGTTRRAAKMVCLDMDHPDIQDFVNWKVKEEQKVASSGNRLKLHDRSSTRS